MRGITRLRQLAAIGAAGAVITAVSGFAPATHQPAVLTVGTYHGHPGMYTSIQAAVNAAQRGDWILVGPGDYHETADAGWPQGDPSAGDMGGVYITTSDLHLRGMNRNTVVVDGTLPGSSQCSSDPAAQNFGPTGPDGTVVGRNGILVWKANNVSVDNLTVCNFLAGTGDSGNQVWWNGGASSGLIGMHGYSGKYLTATSTYFGTESTASQYGIFVSNTAGPGHMDQLYGSNMNDSGLYIGACQQVCDVTVNHAWMEYSALGYSGTNSGGALIIENSQFDNNQDGVDTNTQVNGDAPAPQNGTCPGGAISPITHTTSCWVFMHNYVHDNNNPNAPASGGAAAGPVGTGMTVSGGTNDTVMDNVFANNGAWGVLFIPFADNGTPSNGQTCAGAGGAPFGPFPCVLDPKGDALLSNTFSNNGTFGNVSNSDYGQVTLFGGEPSNCFRLNNAPDRSAPWNLESLQPRCGITTTAANTGGKLFGEVLCDTGFGLCPPGSNYPQRTGVVLHPLPAHLPTMANPCSGVPASAWCPASPAPASSPVRTGGIVAVAGAGLVAVIPGRRIRPVR